MPGQQHSQPTKVCFTANCTRVLYKIGEKWLGSMNWNEGLQDVRFKGPQS